MELSYEWTSAFAQSFGLIYLMVLSVAIAVYAFWPSLGKRFDKAVKSGAETIVSLFSSDDGGLASRVRGSDDWQARIEELLARSRTSPRA